MYVAGKTAIVQWSGAVI